VVTAEPGHLRRVGREIDRLAESDERIESVGRTANAVSVHLRADAEPLAARLHDRYDDAVELLVGGIPFPPSDIPSDLRCPNPPAEPWPAGVTATLELDDDTVPQGGSTHGVATVKNTSNEQFVLEVEEPVLGWVYDVGETSTPQGHPGVVDTPVPSGSEPTGPRRVLALANRPASVFRLERCRATRPGGTRWHRATTTCGCCSAPPAVPCTSHSPPASVSLGADLSGHHKRWRSARR
jgi:hypothetical protein